MQPRLNHLLCHKAYKYSALLMNRMQDKLSRLWDGILCLPDISQIDGQFAIVESRTGAVESRGRARWLGPCGNAPFPVPAHQTGRADFPHPAFRLVSPRGTRRRAECGACCRSSGRWQTRPAAPIGVRLRRGVKLLQKRPDPQGCSRLIANHRSSAPSKAHQKQGPFPPPALPGLHGRTALSDSRPTRRLCGVGAASPGRDGSPPMTRITLPTCRAPYPGGSRRVHVSIASPLTRPSPFPRRVGIRIFTFEMLWGGRWRDVTIVAGSNAMERPMAQQLDDLSRSLTPLVQFQRTCWWSSSRRSHPKCWCTRSMSSWAVNVRSGSTIARLPCNQRGSIGLSQGLFTGNRHTRIRTPPVRFTVWLCVPIHARTARLTCQAALSHTSTHTRLPSAASRSAPQARNSVVTRLTGRPSTKRSSTRSWSVRRSP